MRSSKMHVFQQNLIIALYFGISLALKETGTRHNSDRFSVNYSTKQMLQLSVVNYSLFIVALIVCRGFV